MLKRAMLLTGALSLISCFSWALPACLDNAGQALSLNNDQVLQWKAAGQDQFHSRGHVKGSLVRNYPDHTGHTHFEVQIGNDATDTIEVIYNQSFGDLPDLTPGLDVEVCGDYITTGSQGNGASPDGAIIHWVHKNPSGHGHPSGYVAINGVAYGNGNGNGN